ncbi:MAG: YkgJ family cysteine cluster protein [Infirmifilum sp.]
MPYYALREPTGREEQDLHSLAKAASVKQSLLGVYYSPRLRRLLAVFEAPSNPDVEVFEEVDPEVVREAYKMECPRCGYCCAVNSGAFILDRELEKLPEQARLVVEEQPSRTVQTPHGAVRVYHLGTGPRGSCVFYNPQTRECLLEKNYGKLHKPIICLLTYCTVFASKNGKPYLKAAVKKLKDTWLPVYREATEEQWTTTAEKMASRARN